MARDKIQNLRWSVQQRLAFIDFKLSCGNRINRSHLMSAFNISIAQASTDFSTYKKIAPENIKYDLSGKFYYASSKFKPIVINLKREKNNEIIEKFIVRREIMQPQKITEMFAFVVTEENGGEGVLGASPDGKMMMPLVGADMDRVEFLKPIAKQICAMTGTQYRILKFKLVGEIEA